MKEKFQKTLKDWKFWVFTVLPICCIIALITVGVVSAKQDNIENLKTVTIVMFALYTAILLGQIVILLYRCFNDITSKKILFAVILIVIAIALAVGVVFAFDAITKAYDAQAKRESLRAELEQIDTKDERYKELREEISKALQEYLDNSLKLKIYELAFMIASLAVSGINSFVNKKSDQNVEDNAPKPNNTVLL